MNTNFGPYSIRNLRPKSAKVAANGYTATLLRNAHPVANLDCGYERAMSSGRKRRSRA